MTEEGKVPAGEDPGPRFSKGDLVHRVNQPEAFGVIQEAIWSEQQEGWNYSVAFGPQLRMVPGGSLRLFEPPTGPWDGPYAGADHFRFLLTYHRLRRPPSRIAHSFARSRTQFYPHQFKPLLKFLDHPGKRLLIADDVGLGKTIEAGYVLQELKAREAVERVLIIVPARLTRKWKWEMAERFGETFEIVSRRDLLQLTKQISEGREPDPFRWIVSFEAARSSSVRQAFDETQPALDVLIADEAHHMRNPEALQHKLGASLCRCADTVLFLTATPVQNKLEDLWNLLRLLSPEEFSNAHLFSQQMEANRYVLRAQLALAASPPDLARAGREVEAFLALPGGAPVAGSPLGRSVRERLSRTVGDRRDVVELQSDIARLSPIGHVISRTRKVDAIPGKAQRDASWHAISLTEAERTIYDNVAAFCRPGESTGEVGWGSQMALLMAYRMTASCIPAALRYFADKLRDERSALFEPSQDEDQLGEEPVSAGEEASSGPASVRALLQNLVDRFRVEAIEDSKLKALMSLLAEIWAADEERGRPPQNVVVFSFFRGTLDYLADALQREGIVNRMIHGRVPLTHRLERIDEFLERPDVRVLLSSEVGGEGIDLQRASVIVNYDLPWNPMVVEQRIGRLDRIGQEASRIIIRNLVIRDSVEERVLQRLLAKIGIFKESIGELDPIIGEEVESLVTKTLRGELSDEQLATQLEERERAIELRVTQARAVLTQVDGLLAADQALIDEVNAVTGDRQIPDERDLCGFLNTFLARRYQGCQIPQEAISRPVRVDLSGPLADALSSASATTGNTDWASLARRFRSGLVSVSFSREVGYRHPRTEVLTLTHPLIGFAVDAIRREPSLARKFGLRVQSLGDLPRGRYAFGAAVVEFHSQWDFSRLAVVFASLDGSGEWTDPDTTTPLLVRVLEEAEAWEAKGLAPEDLSKAKQLVSGGLDRIVARWEEREHELARMRVGQRRAALVTTHQLRVGRAEDRVKTLSGRDAPAFSVRMAEAKVAKARQELRAAESEPEVVEWRGGEREDVAVGILLVGSSD